MKWIENWQDLFMESIKSLPDKCMLSFSGGIESSSIMFAMAELGRLPKKAITFTVQDKPTADLPYAETICHHLGVPLKVIDIDDTKDELIEKVRRILRVTNMARNIDIQVCYIYLHMLPYLYSDLVTGFYEDIHYESNAKVSIMYRQMLKNQIARESFDSFYKYGRKCVYKGRTKSGKPHNYVIIEKFLKHHGINLHCPFKTKELFDLAQTLTFEDTCMMDGKFKKKWFLTQVIFKKWFDKFGNQKNTNNMHTTGIKQLHRKLLLSGTKYKDTAVIYRQILQEVKIENVGRLFD